MPDEGSWCSSLEYSPNGETLAFCVDDHVHLVDANTHEPLAEGPVGDRPTFTADGALLVGVEFGFVGGTASIVAHDARTLEPVGVPITPRTGFTSRYILTYPTAPSYALTADGREVVTASAAGELAWWNLYTGKKQRAVPISPGRHVMALSPDGRVAALGVDDGIEVVDTRTGAVRIAAGVATQPHRVVFSPDGDRIASTSLDGTVAVWDVASATLEQTLRGHSAAAQQAAFSPDGRTLYTVSFDGSAIAWDLTGERGLGQSFRFTHDRAFDASYDRHPGKFSPDGRLIAVGLKQDGVRLWDAERLTALGPPLTDTQGEVKALAFSPDGKLLVALSLRGNATVWDVDSRALVRGPFTASSGGDATGASISADGTMLATAGVGGVTVWDLATGAKLGSLATGVSAGGVAFSPSGADLVTIGEWEGQVEFWNVSGMPPTLLAHHEPSSNYGNFAVVFSPDGERLPPGGWGVPCACGTSGPASSSASSTTVAPAP